jgi:hypothetical protein
MPTSFDPSLTANKIHELIARVGNDHEKLEEAAKQLRGQRI